MLSRLLCDRCGSRVQRRSELNIVNPRSPVLSTHLHAQLPAWHRHTHVGELRDHLAQGGALAAHFVHIGVAEFLVSFGTDPQPLRPRTSDCPQAGCTRACLPRRRGQTTPPAGPGRWRCCGRRCCGRRRGGLRRSSRPRPLRSSRCPCSG